MACGQAAAAQLLSLAMHRTRLLQQQQRLPCHQRFELHSGQDCPGSLGSRAMGLCASSPAPPGAVPASNGSAPEPGPAASPRASLREDESLAAKPAAGEEAPPGAAAPSVAVGPSDRTRVVLRWRRGPCIGRGGSGAVFVARQPDTGALFAVKEVDLSKLSAEAIKDIRTEINTLR